MRTVILLCLLTLIGLGLTACNTVNGIGKDFESAGQTLQDI